MRHYRGDVAKPGVSYLVRKRQAMMTLSPETFSPLKRWSQTEFRKKQRQNEAHKKMATAAAATAAGPSSVDVAK